MAALWLGRLSEGWCPRFGHPRLTGTSGAWCTPCGCEWHLWTSGLIYAHCALWPGPDSMVLREETARRTFAWIDQCTEDRSAASRGAALACLAGGDR